MFAVQSIEKNVQEALPEASFAKPQFDRLLQSVSYNRSLPLCPFSRETL
jgi:hypothetical protein